MTRDALRVGDAFLDEVLDAGEDVLHLDVVLVADQVGDELVAVAGRAAVVRAEHGVALGGEVEPAVVRVEAAGRLWLEVVGPPWMATTSGSACRPSSSRSGSSSGAADLGAVGSLPGDVFDGGELPVRGVGVGVDKATGSAEYSRLSDTAGTRSGSPRTATGGRAFGNESSV